MKLQCHIYYVVYRLALSERAYVEAHGLAKHTTYQTKDKASTIHLKMMALAKCEAERKPPVAIAGHFILPGTKNLRKSSKFIKYCRILSRPVRSARIKQVPQKSQPAKDCGDTYPLPFFFSQQAKVLRGTCHLRPEWPP